MRKQSKKRGLHRNLNWNRLAMFLVVLIFGVLISISVLDVYGSQEEFENGI